MSGGKGVLPSPHAAEGSSVWHEGDRAGNPWPEPDPPRLVQRWLAVPPAGQAPAGWPRAWFGGQEAPLGGRRVLGVLRAGACSLAGLRLSHLWLQGSSGAPGPGGSPGTPVSTASPEPKPGVRDGFPGVGLGLLGRSGGGIRARAPGGLWESRWPCSGLGPSRGTAGGHCRGNPWPQGSLKHPIPCLPPAGTPRRPGAERRQGGCSGRVTPLGAVPRAWQPLPARLHRRARPLGSGLPGASQGPPRGPPSPGLSLTVPTGQGEPCEVCPTISEGMLGAAGVPGKPGPRGAPGAPGKDGVSVSRNRGACGRVHGVEGRAGSCLRSLRLPLHLPLPRTDPALQDPKGTG